MPFADNLVFVQMFNKFSILCKLKFHQRDTRNLPQNPVIDSSLHHVPWRYYTFLGVTEKAVEAINIIFQEKK
jgi:hypothetical protein